VIRVLIADDHPLVRAGIASLLAGSDDIEVVGEAADGIEAVEAVLRLQPDLVLMDLSMPRMDGCAATRRIHDSHPEVRVVALSSYADREDVLDALEAGAVGYLLKDAPPDDLVAGIRAATRDEPPLAPRAVQVVVSEIRSKQDAGALTARERDVLVLLAEGLANKVIARRLGIAEKTVKAHVTHIFQVLAVTDRTQAALWVAHNGLAETVRERRHRPRDERRAGG
jgi:DNA-binding NarL/FixJ family response regulator